MTAKTAEAWILPVLLILLPLAWTATRDWFSTEARALRRIEAWQAVAAKVSDEATRAAMERETEVMVRDLVARHEVARDRTGVLRELVRELVPSLLIALGVVFLVGRATTWSPDLSFRGEDWQAWAGVLAGAAVAGAFEARKLWRERRAVKARVEKDRAEK